MWELEAGQAGTCRDIWAHTKMRAVRGVLRLSTDCEKMVEKGDEMMVVGGKFGMF